MQQICCKLAANLLQTNFFAGKKNLCSQVFAASCNLSVNITAFCGILAANICLQEDCRKPGFIFQQEEMFAGGLQETLNNSEMLQETCRNLKRTVLT